jgi:hypothetical protein
VPRGRRSAQNFQDRGEFATQIGCG